MLRPSKYRCHFCEFSSLFSFQGLSSKQSVFCGFFCSATKPCLFGRTLDTNSAMGPSNNRGPWLGIRKWRRIHWILEIQCIIPPPAPLTILYIFSLSYLSTSLSITHLILMHISSKTWCDTWDGSFLFIESYLLSLIDLFLGACLAPLSLLTLLDRPL